MDAFRSGMKFLFIFVSREIWGQSADVAMDDIPALFRVCSHNPIIHRVTDDQQLEATIWRTPAEQFLLKQQMFHGTFPEVEMEFISEKRRPETGKRKKLSSS